MAVDVISFILVWTCITEALHLFHTDTNMMKGQRVASFSQQKDPAVLQAGFGWLRFMKYETGRVN